MDDWCPAYGGKVDCEQEPLVSERFSLLPAPLTHPVVPVHSN